MNSQSRLKAVYEVIPDSGEASVFQPEEFAIMKQVFDGICLERSISPGDLDARHHLAHSIFKANRTRLSNADVAAVARESLLSGTRR